MHWSHKFYEVGRCDIITVSVCLICVGNVKHAIVVLLLSILRVHDMDDLR